MENNYKFIGAFGSEFQLEKKPETAISYNNQKVNFITNQLANVATEKGFTLIMFGKCYQSVNIENEAEFILSQYIKTGVDVFRLLDGEFTILIFSNDEFVVCRDRHGAGPQFFYTNEYFANNLFDLASVKGFHVEPDINALSQFLSIGYIPSPRTSLKGVKKLTGGSCLNYSVKGVVERQLFTFDDYKMNYGTLKMTEKEAIEEYERLHKLAIKSRVDGQQSVGLLMSGGYDSGGNISALRDMYQGKVKTYSIGFKDNPWSELPLAAKLAQVFDSEHQEYEIDGNEIMQLPKIIRSIGDPFQEGGLMLNFVAMGLIGDQKPDVILGGDGNDQLHGTAGKELALNFRMRKMALSPIQDLLETVLENKAFDKNNKVYRLKFHNEKINNILKSDNFGFSKSEVKKLLKPGLKPGKHEYLNRLPTKMKGFDELFMVHNFFGDIKQVINEVILFKASRMAEMYSNPLTFPYMSTDLYNFLATVPRDLKFHGSVDDLSKGKGVSKYLHKSYLKPKLPTEITGRKKQGGFAPLPIFFKSADNRKLFASIIQKSSIVGELLNGETVSEFLTKYEREVQNPSYWFWYDQVKAFRYFNLLMLTVWWEMMINKKEMSSLNEFK